MPIIRSLGLWCCLPHWAICYFIVLHKGSTCFGHYYAHHQELGTVMLFTKLVVQYKFRITIPMDTNNISNYQTTNETHYTQENTTITTHKRSQTLILIETRNQRQRTSHRTHTTKNRNFRLTLPLLTLQNETTNVVINIIVASSWWWAE